MARPSPVPPKRRGGGVHLAERLKQLIDPVGGNANARVVHCKVDSGQRVIARTCQRPLFTFGCTLYTDHYFALFGELDGVAEKIDQDLAQARHIAQDGHGNAGLYEIGQSQSFLRRFGR
jgi:hypothetical protein